MNAIFDSQQFKPQDELSGQFQQALAKAENIMILNL